ncbi:MAG: ribonuclease, partial [Eubacterium sp.]|nr:ribonuclease [Eubacterium sp.]
TTESVTEINTEEGSYQTAVIHESWDNYEITTNEIGYDPNGAYLEEDGYYTSQEDVATYIIEYGTLPDNFITKKEARSLGWSGGSLDEYAEDCSIGGDYFGNREGLLPVVKGRTYYECDIDTMNARKRGSKRIIYSNDGQIYYTDDHYESFTLIYGTDE